jgi:hypothetical protein
MYLLKTTRVPEKFFANTLKYVTAFLARHVVFSEDFFDFLGESNYYFLTSMLRMIDHSVGTFIVSCVQKPNIKDVVAQLEQQFWDESSLLTVEYASHMIKESMLLRSYGKESPRTMTVTAEMKVALFTLLEEESFASFMDVYLVMKQVSYKPVKMQELLSYIIDHEKLRYADGVVSLIDNIINDYLEFNDVTNEYPTTQRDFSIMQIMIDNGEIELIEYKRMGTPDHYQWMVIYSFGSQFYQAVANTRKCAKRICLSGINLVRQGGSLAISPPIDMYARAAVLFNEKPNIRPGPFVRKMAMVVDPENVDVHTSSLRGGVKMKPSRFFIKRYEMWFSVFYLLHPWNASYSRLRMDDHVAVTSHYRHPYLQRLGSGESLLRTPGEGFQGLILRFLEVHGPSKMTRLPFYSIVPHRIEDLILDLQFSGTINFDGLRYHL